MNFRGLSLRDAAFRDEVRSFLAAELSPEVIRATDRVQSLFPPPSLTLPWQRKLLERGWLGAHWSREHGGPGWSAMQRFIFDTECGLAGAPLLAPFGLKYLGPVLIRYGTDAQRARFLPRILRGDDYWCQGYSEPGAGSDLASLQCAARREGDEYVVNGTKIWTTHAHFANWVFCLVRTSVEPRRQAGISFLLVDLATPGITVTPIITIGGEHEVNQVFFDDVRVPAENLVGEPGQGWEIARYLLEFERGGFIVNGFLGRKLMRCRRLFTEVFGPSQSCEARALAARIEELDVQLQTIAAAELHCALLQETGQRPGPEASALKLEFTELMQRIEETTIEILGPRALYYTEHTEGLDDAQADDQALVATYLNNRAATVYGGSNEIQRELIANSMAAL
ncbi:MAG: acyl-CoA dehydrogenase family protein [Steroidobacteraceae bacterium]